MSNAQLIAFVLLWVVILIEGILLLLLYRHVGLIYGQKIQNLTGLTQGVQAPIFQATNGYGESFTFNEILSGGLTFLIFGSFHCSSCRDLLTDREVQNFLQSHETSGYFIINIDEAKNDELMSHKITSKNSLEVISVSAETFRSYAVPVTPFAYVLSQDNRILAGSVVGNGMKDIMALYKQSLDKYDQPSLVRISLTH